MEKRQLNNTLKIQRAIHNLTQAQLAERVDVTRKTINTIETRKLVPSTVLALKLAISLGVAVEDLFSLVDNDVVT